MRTFCTLSDINYLLKGLTLYESLKRTEKTFNMHYLCLDDFTFDKLKKLNLNNLIVWHISDLLEEDEKLKESKNRLTYSNFCFSLAAYFSNYILKVTKQNVYYLDSDLFFYSNLDVIEKEIGNKSIGIIRHRHVERGHFVGEYNVGLVYFKYDTIGLDCSYRWWGWVINPSNEHYREYGTCGDQKYLELFDFYYKGRVAVIEEESSHVAPFNFHMVDWSFFNKSNREVMYKGKKHTITFCHFMKFKPHFQFNRYEATNEPHNQKFMNIEPVRFLYDEYFNSSKMTKEKYKL